METTERVRLLVAPLAQDLGLEIYDIEYSGGVVRVTVDRSGGVDIGQIGTLTRALSRALDEEDPLPGEYTLEVSSPGLERPLRTPAHYALSIGETVAIKTHPGVEGDRRVIGELVAADEKSITVRPEGAEGDATRTLAIADIERARTVFSWGPAPKPGGPKPGGRKAPSKSSTTKKARP